MNFDHIAITGKSLAEATVWVEEALGVPLQTGGEHKIFGTHNTLLGLTDGLYLEVVTPNPAAPAPDRPRCFDLDNVARTPRLATWICNCRDLPDLLGQLGAPFGRSVDLTRGDLRWRMSVPDDGSLPFEGAAPTVIQWQIPTPPAQSLVQQGVTLERLILAHPDAAQITSRISAHLDDPRVVFESGPLALRAEMMTPHGRRSLEG